MRRAVPIVPLAFLILAGLFFRADNLGARSFSVDEVLHVLAARSLDATGEPTLPGGERYERAFPVTWAVAAAFDRFGESEAAARLPIVLVGVLAIPALYLLGASVFGRTAGLVAAGLLAASPDAVAMSRFVRMYAPAQLLVILAALAVWRGLEAAAAWRAWAWLASGAGLLAGAASLHPEALAFLPPLALYVVAVAAVKGARGGVGAALRWPGAAVLGAGAAVAAVVLVAAPDLALRPLRVALTRLPWFPGESWDPKFYHWYLGATYSYLWFLMPAATMAALLSTPRAAWYAALLFWMPFLAISAVVPTQSPRYVFLLLPFFFLLTAEAGRMAGRLVWDRLVLRLREILPHPRLVVPVAAAVFVATLAVVVRGSPWLAAAQSNRLKATGEFAGASYEQWREVAAFVRASSAPDAAIVANADHLARYYLGRIDGRLLYTYQAPHANDRDVERTPAGWRFVSYRSGAPSFSGVRDLAAFVERHPRGWLVLERRRLGGRPSLFAPGVEAFVLARLEARATPADESLAVFFWDHGARLAQGRDEPVDGR